MATLTIKQNRFIEEYLVDLNATQACIRAGYSKNTAAEIGYENLTKPHIQAGLIEAMDKRSKQTGIDAEYVLRRHAEIDQLNVKDIFNDIGSLKPIDQWPDSFTTTINAYDLAELKDADDIATVLKKIRLPDKQKNLADMGRHVNVQAYREKVEVDTCDTLSAALLAARKRVENAKQT